MLPSTTDVKTSSEMTLPHKLFHHTTNFLMMLGAVPGIAFFNILDEETWKRGFVSVILGMIACVITLPLCPFLGLAIACSVIEDKFFP